MVGMTDLPRSLSIYLSFFWGGGMQIVTCSIFIFPFLLFINSLKCFYRVLMCHIFSINPLSLSALSEYTVLVFE